MEYTVRPLLPEEMEEALALVWEVFQEFEAPEYSEEGIAEFAGFIRPAAVAERVAREEFQVWGCIADGKVVGVIATRPPCHISLLFVDKTYHRRGIAKALLRRVLEGNGGGVVTVNSSPYAVEAYRRMGFRDTGGEQTVNGIRYVPMERVPQQN